MALMDYQYGWSPPLEDGNAMGKWFVCCVGDGTLCSFVDGMEQQWYGEETVLARSSTLKELGR